MAVAALNNAQILVGAFDLSGFTGTIEETPGSVSVQDVTTFASGGFATMVPAIKSGAFRFAGFADHAENTGVSAVFAPAAAIGTQYAVSVAIPASGTTPTYGDVAIVGRGLMNAYTPMSAPVDGPAALSMGFATDTRFAYGKVGAPLASRTTSGLTGTAVALTGPSATQSLYAALHVTAASGTNLVVKVQSDDNSGFTSATDRITFSTVSATGWQFSSVAGNLSTETYWRVTATIASGSFTFAVTFGVV